MDWVGTDLKGRGEEGREGNRLKGRRWNLIEFDFAVMSEVGKRNTEVRDLHEVIAPGERRGVLAWSVGRAGEKAAAGETLRRGTGLVVEKRRNGQEVSAQALATGRRWLRVRACNFFFAAKAASALYL